MLRSGLWFNSSRQRMGLIYAHFGCFCQECVLFLVSRTGSEMATITLDINGRKQPVDVAPETPLLWVLRETLGMTGTKFGCGRGLCGSCTVHIDGEANRSCVTPVGSVEGKKITTIERLSPVRIHPLQ